MNYLKTHRSLYCKTFFLYFYYNAILRSCHWNTPYTHSFKYRFVLPNCSSDSNKKSSIIKDFLLLVEMVTDQI